MKKTVLFLATYVAAYVLFRFANTEIWDKDGKSYVIFPTWDSKAIYYLFRPLTLVDAKLTGMNFHIGPHQE